MNVLHVFDHVRDARGLSAKAKLVLFLLVSHGDKDLFSYPSQPLLADESDHDERTVRRALVELRDLGVIEVSPGRQRHSTRYTVRADRLAALARPAPPGDPSQGGHHARPEASQGGHYARPDEAQGGHHARPERASRAPQGGQPCTPGWTAMLPRAGVVSDEGTQEGSQEGTHVAPPAPAAALTSSAASVGVSVDPAADGESVEQSTPEPPLVLTPASRTKKAKRAKAAKHTADEIAAKEKLVEVFVEAFTAAKGVAPSLSNGGDHAAAFALAMKFGVEEASAIVRRAIASTREGWSPTFRTIASNPDAWRGNVTTAPTGARPRHAVQGGDWRELRRKQRAAEGA